jgi:hypothetical protein
MASMKMPFGKYRGKRLISIPVEYFTWLLEKNEDLDPELRRAVEQEMDRRGEKIPEKEGSDEPEKGDEPEKKPKPTPRSKATPHPEIEVKHVSALGQRLSGDLRMLFRNLALKYHPDRGGSAEAMQALNELHDQVQELLARTFTP